jgi:hypothetical protein
MSGAKDVSEGNVRIISATPTGRTSRSGGTVERMRRTIITFGISTIDLFLFGEDQVTAGGTLFKGEMSMTHRQKLCLKLRETGKRGTGDGGECGTRASSAEVRPVVGGRGQGVGVERVAK